MPGVKRLHQESEDVSKPEWIRGHYFSALGLLLRADKALFASLIVLKVHDGIEGMEEDAAATLTLVDKMALLCVKYMDKGSYALLDAYYASAKVLTPFREQGIHLISRVRITTVAHAAFSRRPGKHGPGRPRQWGSNIKLRELFAPIERFINLNAIALGLLQVLALEMPKTIWQHFPLWFRTLPKHGYPSERIVLLALTNQLEVNLSQSRPALLLDKLLRAKIGSFPVPENSDLAA